MSVHSFSRPGRQKGFTLIELMICVAIIGIGSIVAVRAFGRMTVSHKEWTRWMDARIGVAGLLGDDLRKTRIFAVLSKDLGQGPLVLELFGGERVTYFLADGTLFRTREGGGLPKTATETVAEGIVEFSVDVRVTGKTVTLVSCDYLCKGRKLSKEKFVLTLPR